MKICIVISTISSGGAERNACLLANHFSKKNNVEIFTYQKTKKSFYNLSRRISVKNLNLLVKNENFIFRFINFFKRLFIIYRNLKKEKPEVLISFLETTNITVLIASMFINEIKLKIVSDRNNPKYSEKKKILYLLKSIFYRFSNFLVLQTKKIKENYKFIESSKIKIIPNTLSKNIFIKKKNDVIKDLKIISVGRLEYQKGYKILLQALCILVKKKIKFKCDIFGQGSERKYIQNYININKLNKYVKLKGVTRDILKMYKNYNLYILSSFFEGCPNSLLEAQSSGLTCISSNCDYGPSEIIINNENGLLFKNGDATDLSKKILFLIKNKKKFKIFSNNSKKKFEIEQYNRDKIKKWEELIKIK